MLLFDIVYLCSKQLIMLYESLLELLDFCHEGDAQLGRMARIQVKCRRCRTFLLSEESAVDSHGRPVCELDKRSCGGLNSSGQTHLFISLDNGPPWISEVIEEQCYTQGKLLCPRCQGRLGSFDFVRSVKMCYCGETTLPPIHLLCDRIDILDWNAQQDLFANVVDCRVRRPDTHGADSPCTSSQEARSHRAPLEGLNQQQSALTVNAQSHNVILSQHPGAVPSQRSDTTDSQHSDTVSHIGAATQDPDTGVREEDCVRNARDTAAPQLHHHYCEQSTRSERKQGAGCDGKESEVNLQEARQRTNPSFLLKNLPFRRKVGGARNNEDHSGATGAKFVSKSGMHKDSLSSVTKPTSMTTRSKLAKPTAGTITSRTVSISSAIDRRIVNDAAEGRSAENDVPATLVQNNNASSSATHGDLAEMQGHTYFDHTSRNRLPVWDVDAIDWDDDEDEEGEEWRGAMDNNRHYGLSTFEREQRKRQRQDQEEEELEAEPVAWEFMCPMCLEVMLRPHTTLPCRHNFCEWCLRRFNSTLSQRQPRSTVDCPLCRQRILRCLHNAELEKQINQQCPLHIQKQRKEDKRTQNRTRNSPLPGVNMYTRVLKSTASRIKSASRVQLAILIFTALLVMALSYVGMGICRQVLSVAAEVFDGVTERLTGERLWSEFMGMESRMLTVSCWFVLYLVCSCVVKYWRIFTPVA